MIIRILCCAILQFCIIGYVFGMVPQITRLNVQCDRAGMKVNVEFDNPFNGIIFSKGHYSDPACRWVAASSSRRQFNFYIGTSKCGTIGTDMARGNANLGFKNVIIIQNDPDYQDVFDSARKLSCDWVNRLEKYITFAPFGVDMLGVKELRFPGDTVDCWMDIQRGHGPFAPSVGGVVPIGEKLTVVIYVRDTDSSFDVHVKDCYAYDTADYRNPEARAIRLTDERGCPVKEKLVQGFYRTRDVRQSGATIISYGIINAFKFPERMDVFLACNVEVCKGSCPNNDCQPEVAVAGEQEPTEMVGKPTAPPETADEDEDKEPTENGDGSSTTESTGDGDDEEKPTGGDEEEEKPDTDKEEDESKDEESKDEESKDEESKDEESKDEESKDEESKDEETKDEESKDEESKDEESKDEETTDEESKDEESKDEESKDEETKEDEPKEESNDVDSEKADDKADEEQKEEDDEESKGDDEAEEDSERKAAKIKLAKKKKNNVRKAKSNVAAPRKRNASKKLAKTSRKVASAVVRKSAKKSAKAAAAATTAAVRSAKLKKDEKVVKVVKVKKPKSKSKSKSKKSSDLKASSSNERSKNVKPRIIRAPSSIPAAFSRQLRRNNQAFDELYHYDGRHIRSRRSVMINEQNENATFPAMMHSISIISPVEDLDEKEMEAWQKMIDLEGKSEVVNLLDKDDDNAITKSSNSSTNIDSDYCFSFNGLVFASILLAALVLIISITAMICLHLHSRSSMSVTAKITDLY